MVRELDLKVYLVEFESDMRVVACLNRQSWKMFQPQFFDPVAGTPTVNSVLDGMALKTNLLESLADLGHTFQMTTILHMAATWDALPVTIDLYGIGRTNAFGVYVTLDILTVKDSIPYFIQRFDSHRRADRKMPLGKGHPLKIPEPFTMYDLYEWSGAGSVISHLGHFRLISDLIE